MLRVTGSRAAAAIGAALFALNPDVLYLQSTPMTEPLLFGLVLLSISLVYDWVEVSTKAGLPAVARGATRARAKAGWCLVLACLTRYEAWVVTAAVLLLGGIALWRRGFTLRDAIRATADLAIYPVLAIVMFFFHSWFTTGAWFVTGGFYVPDNVATGNVWKAFVAVVYGMRLLIGTPLILLALGGVLLVARARLTAPEDAGRSSSSPSSRSWCCRRTRFSTVTRSACATWSRPSVGAAVFAGIALGMLKGRWRDAAAAAMAVWLMLACRPLNAQRRWSKKHSGMCLSASRGRTSRHASCATTTANGSSRAWARSPTTCRSCHSPASTSATSCTKARSRTGRKRLKRRTGRVGWILVEERAEGGDVLAKRARESSAFTTGLRRVYARTAGWRSTK